MRGHVTDDGDRRPEGTGGVLGSREVDRDLAADGGVGHAQPGRGHGHEAHAAHVERCRRPDHVGRGSATDADPGIAALGTHGTGGLEQPLHVAQALLPLPSGDVELALGGQCRHQRGQRHSRSTVRDDDRHAGAGGSQDVIERGAIELVAQHHPRRVRSHAVVATDQAVEEASRRWVPLGSSFDDALRHGVGRAGGIDADIRGTVEAGPGLAQGHQLLERVARQHGPLLGVTLQPADERGIGRIQPDDEYRHARAPSG